MARGGRGRGRRGIIWLPFFLASVMMIVTTFSFAAATATDDAAAFAAAELLFSDNLYYHLEQFSVQKNLQYQQPANEQQQDEHEKDGQEDGGTTTETYFYENIPDDPDHSYRLTIEKIEDDHEFCSSTSSYYCQISVQIANRFSAKVCLTPARNHSKSSNSKGHGDSNSNTKFYYDMVMIGGRVASTKMMPIDQDVWQLEQQFLNALPQVTTVEAMDDEQDSVLSFSSSSNNRYNIKMVWHAVSMNQANVKVEEEDFQNVVYDEEESID